VALYGLYQQLFYRDPICKEADQFLKIRHKSTALYSFLGNSNYTASYLVPTLFIGLHLGWWIPCIPIIVAIGYSRCRAAWLATIGGFLAGFILIAPAWGILAAVMLVAAGVISLQRIEPTLGRWFYLLCCIKMFKKKPILGWSARVFRRKYFRVQAEMNQADPGILGTPDKQGRNTFPIGRRCHNDHMETLIEVGLVGYILFAIFFGSSLVALVQAPFLFVGLCAALINALFFYNLRTGATAMPVFAIAAVASPGAGVVALGLHLAVPIALVALYLAYRLAIRPFMATAYLNKSAMEENFEQAHHYIKKAASLWPNNNMILSRLSTLLISVDPANSFEATSRMLNYPDGEKIEWATFDLYGRIAYTNRAYLVARMAFLKAIFLNPSYAPAYQGLEQTEATLKDIGKQIEKQQKKDAKIKRRKEKKKAYGKTREDLQADKKPEQKAAAI